MPVGSSAKTSAGRPTRARATATRCCWPPDSSDGRWRSRSPRPTVRDRPRRASARSGLRPASACGSVMFSARVSVGHQVERLEHEADAVAAQQRELLVGQRAQVDVADQDPAGRERVEPGDAVHERRLARARRAHDRREAPGGEGDVDAVEGPHGGVAASVDLDGVHRPAAIPSAAPGTVIGPGVGAAMWWSVWSSRCSPFRVVAHVRSTVRIGPRSGESGDPVSSGWGQPHPDRGAHPVPRGQLASARTRLAGSVAVRATGGALGPTRSARSGGERTVTSPWSVVRRDGAVGGRIGAHGEIGVALIGRDLHPVRLGVVGDDDLARRPGRWRRRPIRGGAENTSRMSPWSVLASTSVDVARSSDTSPWSVRRHSGPVTDSTSTSPWSLSASTAPSTADTSMPESVSQVERELDAAPRSAGRRRRSSTARPGSRRARRRGRRRRRRRGRCGRGRGSRAR